MRPSMGLSDYAGRRIRLRWVGQSWEFDSDSSSYQELGGSWNNFQGDEGWWVDDITLTGALSAPASFVPDSAPPPGTICPEGTCNDLDGDGYGAPADPSCRAGGMLDCAPDDLTIHPGVEESCDGFDNDCDGLVDEDDPALGSPCDSGENGECQAGELICLVGALACEPIAEPVPEICDGFDNNCDGVVDEGNPGGGAGCGGTMIGECRPGIIFCEDGALVCSGVEPIAEICDGLDNNCDGVVDEGDPGGGAGCGGTLGECRPGIIACEGGALVCSGVEPIAEICDGLDNNCDGFVDEGDPGGGAECGGTDVGACSAGRITCQNGELECLGRIDPVTEICDGVDNDCDGVSDELAIATSVSFSPNSLNVNSSGITFSISSNVVNLCSSRGISPSSMSRVYISRVFSPGVGEIILPTPNDEPGCDSLTEDGIWEDLDSRGFSGFSRTTFRFNQPSDGNCETPDGNRQDLIAVLADALDGEIAGVCFRSIYWGDEAFEGCAGTLIRSRGNR